MNARLLLRSSVAILGSTAVFAASPPQPPHERFGAERRFAVYTQIRVENLHGEPLGRIKDLAIDLSNGRIVEVLVASDRFFGLGTRVVEVPPCALIPDLTNEVYRLDMSVPAFKAAASADVLRLTAPERITHLAAVYRHFGQVPCFQEPAGPPPAANPRPQVPLGDLTHLRRLLGLPVANLARENLGKVWTVALDIPQGRILNVVIIAPDTYETKRVVPALGLRFVAGGHVLLLDDSVAEFADEPRYAYTEAANGQDRHYKRESYRGPHTALPLVQGTSDGDVAQTAQINREILSARIGSRGVEIGTHNGRVTLRGWVATAADKRRIAAIAVTVTRLELVDNQITVGRPLVVD